MDTILKACQHILLYWVDVLCSIWWSPRSGCGFTCAMTSASCIFRFCLMTKSCPCVGIQLRMSDVQSGIKPTGVSHSIRILNVIYWCIFSPHPQPLCRFWRISNVHGFRRQGETRVLRCSWPAFLYWDTHLQQRSVLIPESLLDYR